MSAKRHWLQLAVRSLRLMMQPAARTEAMVQQSYDSIATGYDEAWTRHMREKTFDLLDRIDWPRGASVVDLTCGTGFISDQMQQRTGGNVTGIDASQGMIDVARSNYPDCRFVRADVLDFLRSLPSRSTDIVTCGWGLGYSRPGSVIREATRILTPGGYLAVIDNSLFSLAEIFWTSVLCFAESPDALAHAMKVRFLPHVSILTWLMRRADLCIAWQTSGRKTYHVSSGRAAIERLRATGAAAGFEFAARAESESEIYERFALLLENRYQSDAAIPITHRYLGAIGRKRG